MTPQQLGKLLRRDSPSTPDIGTTPTVCTFYNASGCRHGDTKRCHSLHVCKYFLLSGCKFGDKCNRSHNIYDRQPKGVLKSIGVDIREPVDVVLEELKLIMKRENPQDDDDSESSSSDSNDSGEILELCIVSYITFFIFCGLLYIQHNIISKLGMIIKGRISRGVLIGKYQALEL